MQRAISTSSTTHLPCLPVCEWFSSKILFQNLFPMIAYKFGSWGKSSEMEFAPRCTWVSSQDYLWEVREAGSQREKLLYNVIAAGALDDMTGSSRARMVIRVVPGEARGLSLLPSHCSGTGCGLHPAEGVITSGQALSSAECWRRFLEKCLVVSPGSQHLQQLGSECHSLERSPGSTE